MKTKNKKTKTMRRLALAAALLLILALLLAFDAINGDPLSQQWAIYRAIRYAEKLYPEETFHWDQRTAAGGQFFHYVVYVQSDQSRDTNFAVQTRFWLLTDDEIRGKELEPDHVFCVDHRWNTAYRLGDEAAQQAAAYLTVQAPELNFASVYGAKGNTVEIDLCYAEQDGMTPANYVDDLPLDAAFDKALLQKGAQPPVRTSAVRRQAYRGRHANCPAHPQAGAGKQRHADHLLRHHPCAQRRLR